MRARALDPDTFSSLDAFMSTVASAGYAVLVQPWVWLPLVMLGLIIMALAIRGNPPEVLRRVAAALAGLTILTVAAAAPMDLIRSVDQVLVDAQPHRHRGAEPPASGCAAADPALPVRPDRHVETVFRR